MTEPQTLPQYFLAAAKNYGAQKIAMRKKTLGIWKPFSWAESLEQVRAFALGITALGLQRADKVCIIGDNDPEFYWAEIAVQAMGGIACGIFTDATPPEIQYIVAFTDAKFVLAKDQEQVDKLLEARAQLPHVEKVIYWDERGLWSYDEEWLLSFSKVQQIGRELAQQKPEVFEKVVAQGKGDDVALLCTTSGTTGLPKAAMITHKNLIEAQLAAYHTDPRYDSDEYLSFLPLAWITEHGLGIAAHCMWGIIVNFPEEPETVRENLREISPHTALYNPRIWEGIVSQIQVRMQDANWLNRKLYDFFMPLGERLADLKFEKKQPSALQKFLYRLGEFAVYRPLRENLGMQRIRSAYTAGSVLSPDVIRFFHAIGVNLKQLYGSTEINVATQHPDREIKFESVGKPVKDVQLRISPLGEIQVKTPSLFKGYYKNAQATAEKIVDDGWYRTGDAGHIDVDGHLIYLDRVSELLGLAGGEKYSPQYIEGRLKFSPYIKDVMTVGGRARPYLTALINIDFENVGKWAEARGLGYTTYVDLSQKSEVYDLIRKAVERVNGTLPDKARIRKFVLLHKEFDADEGELTRTRKLRRNVVEQRYAEILDALYGERDAVQVRAEVKYRDGRTGVVETGIRVARLV